MNENELPERLRAAADDVVAHSDLAEVELGAGRVRSRRRVATGVVAAMLVAGAGGAGFGIGRSVSDDDPTLAAGDDPVATTTIDDGGDASGDVPARDADEPSDTLPPPPDLAVLPTLPPPEPGLTELAADDGALGRYYAPVELELIYERQLDTGIRVRAQRGEPWSDSFDPYSEWPAGEWRPADFCYGNRELRITLDGPDVVDVTHGAYYDQLFGDVQAEIMMAGWADGQQMRIVAVQAGPAVTEVAVVWDDDANDRAAVVDGIAVLVVAGSDPWASSYTLEVTDADGTRSLDQNELDRFNDQEWRAACEEPPPALPDAGEQPVDAAAERAAIEERFSLLWDLDVPREEKQDVLDDWTGVDEALAAVTEGDFGDIALTATQTIEELVFVGPTEAWFRYSVVTELTNFHDRYGTATLVDGVWQFPRALICQDLSLAGGGCDPWVDQIFPPSWYERYGEPGCWIDESGAQICADVPVGEADVVFEGPLGTVPPPPTLVPIPATTVPGP
ncbi:MAG: hypothetical protein QNJ12_03125 [Ilumatobacter sp.]|uniref:hypothetical protein n=1 Tax=Ilumatobacter sp. TaxID=1967498 RepID=UPI00262F57F1|nr:hypothetical protein [Ilumatobacter sp.]MDJ0767752.1 hypothetical protein [Ilumatobacter sp.]